VDPTRLRWQSPIELDEHWIATAQAAETCLKGHFGHRQLNQVEQTLRSLCAKPMPRQ
jgi:hypothetical protein